MPAAPAPERLIFPENKKTSLKKEGGRYFRTGAYEKEKYYIESFLPSMFVTIPDKCEKSVILF